MFNYARRSATVAALSLAVLLAAIAAWAAVAPSNAPDEQLLDGVPNDRLASHGIRVSSHARPAAALLTRESAAVRNHLNPDYVRQARLVRFEQTRDAQIGPPIDTLAWAFVAAFAPTFSSGPMPDHGVICEQRWRATAENSYSVLFIDAMTGETLAHIAGTLVPVPTPVCRG